MFTFIKYTLSFDLYRKQPIHSQLLQLRQLYLNLVDSENFTKISRRWYANVLPFPLNYFVPGKLHRQASNYVEALYNLDEKAIGVQVLNLN